MNKRLKAYALWRRPLVGAGVLTVVALVLCFVPLFNLLGYEFALVMSLLASLVTGIVAAGYPQRVRDQDAPFPGARLTVLRLYVVAVCLGLASLVVPLALIGLNALRVRNCDFGEGLAFYALGPISSVLVAAGWGLAAGLLSPGRRSATALWVLGWVGAVLLQLWGMWSTPTVRALGAVHGYFSGVLYDEAVSVPAALLTLRARDAVVVAALLCACAWLVDRTRLRLSAKAAGSARTGTAIAAIVLTGVAAILFWLGPELGHRRSAGDVAEALGGRTEHGRCVVIHDEWIPEEQAALYASDCAFRLEQVEDYLGARVEGGLTAYLFLDAGQKQELIGAGRTSVAKPWRGEVYIQGPSFPHPVLRHEIAHVVSGEFGATPLQVSGRFGGLLPSPGLIEGVAVAADWDEGELTAHGWSRAMRELGLAPSIEDVAGLGFLGVSPGRAYTIAGSFSRFLIDTHGSDRYRKAYNTGDLAGAYGESVADLERQWAAHLDEVPLRDGDLDLARDRFDRRSVFAKVCAHEVAQLRQRAAHTEAVADWATALGLRRRIVGFSGDSPRARLELARTLVAARHHRRARGVLDGLVAAEGAPRRVSRAARHLRADLDWSQGRREQALSAYRSLSEEPDVIGARRLLQVKVAALSTPRAEPLVRRFLLGGDRLGPEEPGLALLTLAELTSALPEGGIGHYLLGRQLWNRDEHERAIPYLERADALGLPTWELSAENRRILGIARFRAGRLEEARSTFTALGADDDLPEGLRVEARDWVERCDWQREQRRD